MPVRFVCQHCNQALRVSSKKTGSRVKCPKCEKSITVPSEAEGEAQVAVRKSSADLGTADPFSEFVVFDDSELVYDSETEATSPAAHHDVEVDYSKVAVPRFVLYLQGALIAVVALAGFTLGMLLGGGPSADDNGPQEPVPCDIRGQLVFLDNQGREVPDAGSVVIVLPEDARPEEQFPIAGLRPEAPPPPADHQAILGIQQLGGAYARTNGEGEYQVQLPQRGMYFLFFLSRNSKRSGNTQPQADHLAQLGRYFLPADEMIGDSRYGWSSARIKGNVRRDFAFDPVQR